MIYLNGEFLPIEKAKDYEQGGTPPCIFPIPDRLRYSEEAAR
jgi:hypothetical protein